MLKLRVPKWLCILLTVSILAAVPAMPIFSDEVNTSPEILKNADFEDENLAPACLRRTHIPARTVLPSAEAGRAA